MKQLNFINPPRLRPNRWSLFSHMVSVRPSQKQKQAQTPCMKTRSSIGWGLVGHLKFARLVNITFYVRRTRLREEYTHSRLFTQ